MFPTRCTRYFVQVPQTEMRLRSELRQRSYRFLNRLTDYQLQFRGYLLLCRLSTIDRHFFYIINFHHAKHASFIRLSNQWVISSFLYDHVIDWRIYIPSLGSLTSCCWNKLQKYIEFDRFSIMSWRDFDSNSIRLGKNLSKSILTLNFNQILTTHSIEI